MRQLPINMSSRTIVSLLLLYSDQLQQETCYRQTPLSLAERDRDSLCSLPFENEKNVASCTQKKSGKQLVLGKNKFASEVRALRYALSCLFSSFNPQWEWSDKPADKICAFISACSKARGNTAKC